MKSKREQRRDAIYRLEDYVTNPSHYRNVSHATLGDKYLDTTGLECVRLTIDLLTDDEPSYEGDAFAKGPRDADGLMWFCGDMSDSEWGVIERTYFDGEQWMVCGHDLTAPWVPADSIRHAPTRTATQREDVCRCRNCIATKRNNDLVELLKDAARDYQANVELWHGVASEQTKYINRETMTFPRSADGKAIRIGDELCGYGYPNGGVRCKAIVNERTILAGTDDESYHDWLMWDAWSCRHYHKPTVEEVLREFVITLDQNAHLSNGVATTIAEYVPKLQVKEENE